MSEERLVRQLLVEIERDPGTSQRQLSSKLGVSVGSINWYLKRCISKGLIKLGQAPVKRYLYYLTPEGFSEKARLTGAYLRSSFDIFKTGRQQYEALFGLCAANGWRQIVLFGDSELAELAVLVLGRAEDVSAQCVFDPASDNRFCAGLPVYTKAEDVLAAMNKGPVDAMVVTRFEARNIDKYDLDELVKSLNIGETRLLTPEFIH